jgi:hypothetical protein
MDQPIELSVYFYSKIDFYRTKLEDDLEELLSENGEVTGGGSGESGSNIDLEIFDPENLPAHIKRIRKLLRKYKVPLDTIIRVFLDNKSVYSVYGKESIEVLRKTLKLRGEKSNLRIISEKESYLLG